VLLILGCAFSGLGSAWLVGLGLLECTSTAFILLSCFVFALVLTVVLGCFN
jgi:hypothetical protein